jgi:hypothetical protein
MRCIRQGRWQVLIMGGFAYASVARKQPALAGVVLIDAWDMESSGKALARISESERHKVAPHEFDDLTASAWPAPSLGGSRRFRGGNRQVGGGPPLAAERPHSREELLPAVYKAVTRSPELVCQH